MGPDPFILKRANIDPALASGPFITTVNDILGLLIYLAISLTISVIMNTINYSMRLRSR